MNRIEQIRARRKKITPDRPWGHNSPEDIDFLLDIVDAARDMADGVSIDSGQRFYVHGDHFALRVARLRELLHQEGEE